MRIWSVFSLVIVFHLVVIGLLLVQPGCQSQSGGEPVPEMTTPQTGTPVEEPVAAEPLDPAFNAGIVPQPGNSSRNLSAPTRPTGVTRESPDTGLLQPVLEPVQDELSLPAIKSEYTVQKGDNLTMIARREGVSLADLLSANGLNRTSTIYVGQKLMIPGASRASATMEEVEIEHSGKQVVVAKGDTLSKIAARTGTSVKVLKALNGLTSDTIFVGQKLAVPESGSVPVSLPSAPSPTPVVTMSGQSSYTVQAGDTPSGIARKFGVTTSDLMAANGISDPRKLIVGKELIIPTSGTVTPAQQTVARTPVLPSSETLTTQSQPAPVEPTVDDTMSILEALEDEDLPFVEVEAVEEGSQPGN